LEPYFLVPATDEADHDPDITDYCSDYQESINSDKDETEDEAEYDLV
jgi:hypothetical protein